MNVLTITGAMLAATIAWISIYLAIRLNFIRYLDNKTFQKFGALAVGSIALLIFGLPLPTNLPLIIILTGTIFSVLKRNLCTIMHNGASIRVNDKINVEK